ncbi:MAG: hypothetical protein JXN63_03480 [Candidatus Delongbacteria bacterium]|nr:hypothetical protein [Candidatus Delongbacteria bacterium]
MRISVIIISVLMILSCSGERVLKKNESGREFNAAAENREASVVLETGDTLSVRNIFYKKGNFMYGPEHGDSLSFDSVKSVSFCRLHRLGTGFRYALVTIAAGLIIGGIAEEIEGRDEIPAYFIELTALGLIASPIAFIAGYSTGENIRYEMKHRK